MNTLAERRREAVRPFFEKDQPEYLAAIATGLSVAQVERHYEALLDEVGGKTPDYHLATGTNDRKPAGSGPSASPFDTPKSQAGRRKTTDPQRKGGNTDPALFAPCGTVAAYRRHKRRGEPACDACLEANRAAQKTAPHGTSAAYERHRRHGEDPCEPCVEAARETWRKKDAARRADPPSSPVTDRTPVCGTYNGWSRHNRRKESACGPCTEARREYRRKLSTAAQAAAQDREDQD